MKNLFLSSLLVVTAFGMSSCCCLFSGASNTYETKESKLCGTKTVTREVAVSGKGSKGGMLTETVTEVVPVYRTVTKKHQLACVRSYCPKAGPCGSTGETVIKMATDQGGTGSPHMGLVPTMRVLAP